jgi:hypothetical protein
MSTLTPEEMLTLAREHGDAIYPYPDGEPMCAMQFTNNELLAFAAAIEAALRAKWFSEPFGYTWLEHMAHHGCLGRFSEAKPDRIPDELLTPLFTVPLETP